MNDIKGKSFLSIEVLNKKTIRSLRSTGVWDETCPIPLKRLRIVKAKYWDFKGRSHANGEIMTLDAAAPYVMKIFDDLYEKKFPISKMVLMDVYRGDDNLSMDDNNTSCFNHRPIEGSKKLSLHAYGLAIDINPIQNPYITFPYKDPAIAIYNPHAGRQYANRLQNRPDKPFRYGMVEQIKDVFSHYGFPIWGGNWDSPIDYHHFQVSRLLAELLAEMESTEAIKFFEEHVVFGRQGKDLCSVLLNELRATSPLGTTLLDFYQNEKGIFKNVLGFIKK